MKRMLSASLVGLVLAGTAAMAAADPEWGPGRGWGPGSGHGWGMGPGRMAMMQGRMGGGGAGCPGMAAAGAPGAPAEAVTEDKAKELATEYVGKYFKGYSIERVLPFEGRRGTAYQVELKGPKGESRTLHVTPWGGVRPFGGPLAAGR